MNRQRRSKVTSSSTPSAKLPTRAVSASRTSSLLALSRSTSPVLSSPVSRLSTVSYKNNTKPSRSLLSTTSFKPVSIPSGQSTGLIKRNISTMISTRGLPSLSSFLPSLQSQAQQKKAPTMMAKRNILLDGKPLDPEVGLRLDFNVIKDAEEIVEKADSEYPEWLWTITTPLLSPYDISKIPTDEMTIPQMRRKFKLDRRALIKNNNLSTRKT